MRGGVWASRRGRRRPACRGGLDCRLGTRHGEERTKNIWYMLVTLEVSKLSGWLNTDAYCRELKGGHAMRGEVWAGMTERCGQALCTGPYCGDCGYCGCRRDRTWNMPSMSVTLDVSKLSGWLNAFAYCRVEGGHTMRAGRRGLGGAGADRRLRAQRARVEHTRNIWYMFVTPEVSQLETSALK